MAPRIADFRPESLTPRQRQVYDAVVAGPRGKVEGPLRVWLTSPELAEKAQVLGAFCRFDNSLPARLSELAILVTGARWKAGFEWHVHAPAGRAAGLSAEAVEAIRVGKQPRFERDDEAAVYAFCRELIETRALSDETYRRAVEQIGEKGAVELVGVLGYYALISMTIVAFQVPVPAGAAEPFADVG